MEWQIEVMAYMEALHFILAISSKFSESNAN